MPNNSDSQPNTQDFIVLPIKPPNPPSGVIRFFATGGTLTAIDSSGNTAIGGGITSVASLPALPCTNNTLVTLTSAPFGLYLCISGSWQQMSPSSGVIYATNFGAKGDWLVETNGANFTVTSGSPIVTCTTCAFKASDVGKQIFATNWSGADTTYTTAVAVVPSTVTTILSFQSATQVTMSQNATGNAGTTNGNSGALAFGTDDTAANDLAKAAAYDGINCSSIQLAGPITNWNHASLNSASCRGLSGGSTASKYTGIFGENPSGNTTILLPPWFDITNCTGALSGKACFGGAGGFFNVTFNGLGQSSFALGNHNFLESANDVSYNNVYLWGFAANSALSQGMVFNQGIHMAQNVIADGMGRTPCATNGVVSTLFSLECYNGTPTGTNGNFNVNANTVCFVCIVAGPASSGIGVNVASGVSYTGYGDFGAAAGVFTGGCYFTNGGIIHLDGVTCANNGGAVNSSFASMQGTSLLSVRNSRFAGGTNGAIVPSATGAILYEGGNQIIANALLTTPPTVTGTILGGGTAALDAGINTPERGAATITEGAGAVNSGTLILTFNQTFTLTPAAAIPPACTLTFTNGTGSWNVRVNAIVTTASATAMTWTIDNNAVGLTNGSTYKVAWNCAAR